MAPATVDAIRSTALGMRVVPVPQVFCPVDSRLLLPDQFMNGKLDYYETKIVEDKEEIELLSRAVIEYAISYAFEDETHFELTLQKDSRKGEIEASPKTVLTRDIDEDVTTVTVESTIGFPSSGIIYIENEAISYTSKSQNQFYGCTRGYLGVKFYHIEGNSVYGQRFLRLKTKVDGINYESYNWVLGLAHSIDIVDPGLLHLKSDDVYVNGPGAINPREPILTSFVENRSDALVTQAAFPPEMTDVSFATAGVSAVFFDKEYSLISTSGFPYNTIGAFSNDGSIGPNLQLNDMTFVIPLDVELREVVVSTGTNMVGVFVDGVPAYSSTAPRKIIQGSIADFTIIQEGNGYVNPTVVIEPAKSEAKATVTDGRITDITPTSLPIPGDHYTDDPIVRISSGEGAAFNLDFDLSLIHI